MEESTGAGEIKNAVPEDSVKHWEGMLPERFPRRRRENRQGAAPIINADSGRDAQECGEETRQLAALDRRRTDRRGADRRNADRRSTDRGVPDESTRGRRGADHHAAEADTQDRRATVWMAEVQAERASSFAYATEQEPCLPSWLCGENGTWVIV